MPTVTNQVLILLVLIPLFHTSGAIPCDLGFTEVLNEKTDEAECQKCPDNCSVCFYSKKRNQIECMYCKEKFFLENGKCNPCSEYCNDCVGPALEDCRFLISGYHFNFFAKKIEKCADPNCANCDFENRCSNCLKEYYLVPANSTEAVQSNIFDSCEPCKIEHCEYCVRQDDQVKNGDFIKCSFCKEGYAVVSGQCQPCPQGCQYCEEETRNCFTCEKGYVLDQSSLQCKIPTNEGCAMMKNENECQYCSSGYYLDPGSGKCELCTKISPHCNYCYVEDNVTPKCGTCNSGFYKSDDGPCEPCGEFCSFCSSERCFGCEQGYYFDNANNKCMECRQQNCAFCSPTGSCQYCNEGYYFDETTFSCKRCLEHCLLCFNGPDNCSVCSANYLSFEQEIVTIKQGNNLLMKALEVSGILTFSKSDIQLKTKCVKECPKSVNGQTIITNYLEKACQYIN